MFYWRQPPWNILDFSVVTELREEMIKYQKEQEQAGRWKETSNQEKQNNCKNT